jgi:hypothetical protein
MHMHVLAVMLKLFGIRMRVAQEIASNLKEK